MHMEVFEELYPGCVKPSMPAYHHKLEGNRGFSIVNIGVGPSNANNLMDHVVLLLSDAMLMIGHCTGVRKHQEIGDFVLGSGYMLADQILDQALPLSVPVAPNFFLNQQLARALDEREPN